MAILIEDNSLKIEVLITKLDNSQESFFYMFGDGTPLGYAKSESVRSLLANGTNVGTLKKVQTLVVSPTLVKVNITGQEFDVQVYNEDDYINEAKSKVISHITSLEENFIEDITFLLVEFV